MTREPRPSDCLRDEKLLAEVDAACEGLALETQAGAGAVYVRLDIKDRRVQGVRVGQERTVSRRKARRSVDC